MHTRAVRERTEMVCAHVLTAGSDDAKCVHVVVIPSQVKSHRIPKLHTVQAHDFPIHTIHDPQLSRITIITHNAAATRSTRVVRTLIGA